MAGRHASKGVLQWRGACRQVVLLRPDRPKTIEQILQLLDVAWRHLLGNAHPAPTWTESVVRLGFLRQLRFTVNLNVASAHAPSHCASPYAPPQLLTQPKRVASSQGCHIDLSAGTT